jgi:hypothetical protein
MQERQHLSLLNSSIAHGPAFFCPHGCHGNPERWFLHSKHKPRVAAKLPITILLIIDSQSLVIAR